MEQKYYEFTQSLTEQQKVLSEELMQIISEETDNRVKPNPDYTNTFKIMLRAFDENFDQALGQWRSFWKQVMKTPRFLKYPLLWMINPVQIDLIMGKTPQNTMEGRVSGSPSSEGIPASSKVNAMNVKRFLNTLSHEHKKAYAKAWARNMKHDTCPDQEWVRRDFLMHGWKAQYNEACFHDWVIRMQDPSLPRREGVNYTVNLERDQSWGREEL